MTPGRGSRGAPRPGTAHALERGITGVLRAGVSASLILVAAGTVISFVHHPEYLRSLVALERLTRPGIAPRSFAEVVSGLAAGRGQAIVALGLLLLLATPVIRVAFSLALFLRDRERTFVALTLTVLALLLLSLALGRAGG
ncbi:MAG TPA: DUF1634 domain-containing protein [Candidatus Eisenbacteria bacterium]|jgi:uncharacterized membrane protein